MFFRRVSCFLEKVKMCLMMMCLVSGDIQVTTYPLIKILTLKKLNIMTKYLGWNSFFKIFSSGTKMYV